MSWKEIEKELLERFPDAFSDWDRPFDRRTEANDRTEGSGHRIPFIDPGNRIRVRIKPESFPAVARFLAGSGQARFITATAVDTPGGFLHLWYHFDLFQTPQVLSILVPVSGSSFSVPSITPFLAGADRIEREISEMFGIRFEGHPKPVGLLLPEGWPKSVFPMRKDG